MSGSFKACASTLMVSLILVSGPVLAQVYPARAVRLMVPFGPGGGVDTSSRLVGQKLSEMWGQPVLIENRPGAGGTIATEVVARSAPDGHALVMASPGHALTPSLYKLSYDAVRDFAPVTLVLSVPYVIVVHPSLPARSVQELLALARARPDELLWATSGNGSAQHLALALLKMQTGVRITHVPYKATEPGLTDLIGGRVSVSSASTAATLPHVKAGRLRALAVTGRTRSQAAPALPTVAQAGVPGFELDVRHGIMVPAATPREIVAKLHGDIIKTLAQPDVKDRMLAVGFEPVGDPPERFAAYVRAEVAKYAKLVREAGIRID